MLSESAMRAPLSAAAAASHGASALRETRAAQSQQAQLVYSASTNLPASEPETTTAPKFENATPQKSGVRRVSTVRARAAHSGGASAAQQASKHVAKRAADGRIGIESLW